MATLGELVVNLIAKTAPFESGMKRGKRSVEDLATATEKARAKFDAFVSTMVGRVAAIATVSAGLMAMRSEMNRLDAVLKSADRAGASFEGFQGLAFGAQQSSINIQEFSGAMEQFAGNLGKAQYGTSRAKQALDALGLSAEKLSKLGLEDQIKLLADRIHALPEVELKIGIARDLFGNAGILTFLDQGSEGIAKLADEAKRMGLIMDRESAKSIERTNDAFDKLWTTMKSLAGEVAALSANSGLNLLIDFISETVRLVNQVLSSPRRATIATKEFSKNIGDIMIAQTYGISPTTQPGTGEGRVFNANMMNGTFRGMGGMAGNVVGGRIGGIFSGAAGGLNALSGQIADGISKAMPSIMTHVTASQVRSLSSGIGSIASFATAAAFGSVSAADPKKWLSDVGRGDGGQAKLGGSRAAVEENAKRLREKQLQVEIDQLERLKEMAKAMLDPARIQQFIVTSLGG